MSNVLQRSLSILEDLARHPQGGMVADIALRCDMPAGTARRLLTDLAGEGYARADQKDHFHLTTRLSRLSLTWMGESHIEEIVQPILDGLAEEMRELVRLAVLHDGQLVWVTRAQGVVRGLRYDPQRDYDRTAHLGTTATGQAYLSTLSDDEAVALIAAEGLLPTAHPAGTNAPASMEQALDRVKAARQRGFGLARDILTNGMAAISAPVYQPGTTTFIAAISISGPSARLTEDLLLSHGTRLLETARLLGEASIASRYFASSGARTRDLGEAGIVAL